MKPTMRFFRHDGICRPMNRFFNCLGRSTAPRPGSAQTVVKDAPEVLRPTHRRDEYRPVIPQRVARQQSPPPLHRHAHPKSVPGSATMNLQRTVNSVLTVCLSPGDHPNGISRPLAAEDVLISSDPHLGATDLESAQTRRLLSIPNGHWPLSEVEPGRLWTKDGVSFPLEGVCRAWCWQGEANAT